MKRSVTRASLHCEAVRSLLAFFEVAEMEYCAREEAEIAGSPPAAAPAIEFPAFDIPAAATALAALEAWPAAVPAP